MKRTILFLIVGLIFFSQVKPDTLTTIDRKEYQGKLVAFKFDTFYFNVYKFGKMHHTQRFPLYKVWKIEFNSPTNEGLESPSEMEAELKKLRRGKRVKKINLSADQKWVDTGIKVKIGQDIMFTASGSIYIDEETQVYQNGEMTLTWSSSKPMPNQPTGALIAKIGRNGNPFYVGDDKAPFHLAQKGTLFIGINDYNYKDNSGHFSVTIYY
jgi:hypothetical protein